MFISTCFYAKNAVDAEQRILFPVYAALKSSPLREIIAVPILCFFAVINRLFRTDRDAAHTVRAFRAPDGLSVLEGNISKGTDPFAAAARDTGIAHMEVLRARHL